MTKTFHPFDIKAAFGDRFRIDLDESFGGTESRAERTWYYQVRCRYGHIFPHSELLLAAYADRTRVASRLLSLPCVIPHQVGSTEATVLFAPEDFAQVAAVLQPRRRRRRAITDAQREALVAAGREYRSAARNGSSQEQISARECVRAAETAHSSSED